jgi:hypothetical protein
MTGYLKDKAVEVEKNSEIGNVRDLYQGINEFEKGYHRGVHLLKDKYCRQV